MSDRLLALSKDAFGFLADLAESGNVERVGLPSSPERIEKLLAHVLQESLNILRHEDETVSIEQLGGRTAVRRLVELQHAAAKLPESVRPMLEPTLSQQIQSQSRGRRALTARRKGDA